MPHSLSDPTAPQDRVEVIFTIDELAAFIRKSRATIYSDLTRRPYALPPRVRIPGSNKVLFRDPPAWLAQFVENVPAKPEPAEPASPPPRRRGAPTKAARIEREKTAGVTK
jgi:hypothetical protein